MFYDGYKRIDKRASSWDGRIAQYNLCFYFFFLFFFLLSPYVSEVAANVEYISYLAEKSDRL